MAHVCNGMLPANWKPPEPLPVTVTSEPRRQSPSEDVLRAEFERQHKGRNLQRHRMRGTYISANIAALWNQHKRTAAWISEWFTMQNK
jgi:hypothetical protein